MMNKTVILLALIFIVGAGSGFGFSYMKFSDENLYLETQSKVIQGKYLVLSNLFNKLEANYTVLKDDYKSISVSLTKVREDYELAMSSWNKMKEDYYLLRALNDDLSTQIITLQNEINALNATYSELQEKYDKLLADYNMVNGPSSEFVTVNDLNINMTTTRTIYNYTDPITGTVSIYYKSGEPFKGSITFTVRKEGGGSTTGWDHKLKGETDFYISKPAFTWGPGIYSFKISYIRDLNGFIITGPNELIPSIILQAK